MNKRKNSRKKHHRVGPALEAMPYPYSRTDVSAFFGRHASVRIAYLKAERSLEDFGHYLCEAILHGDGERLFLQGIEFHRNRFRYPGHLEAVPAEVRRSLEQQIIRHLLDTRVVESPLADPALAYTGERIVPGTAPFHAYWMHARRYTFAAQHCQHKRVLDAGCGTGYGTRILSQEAESCLGIDKDPEAIDLARSLFPGLQFRVEDATRVDRLQEGPFDVIVALELLEHLPSSSIPPFLEAVDRALKPGGVFIVSVANRAHQEKEMNPFHLSEMTYEEFRERLRARLRPARLELFGQEAWNGTWQLERECRIVPVRSSTDHHVYLALVRLGP